ncbi:MAG: hypothetical protein LBG21_00095 [Campylobacteraceae bacterium]|jgi:hypothetical protein|nr:hypothetical protein [Campylobacteraceae bacterium]
MNECEFMKLKTAIMLLKIESKHATGAEKKRIDKKLAKFYAQLEKIKELHNG